MLFFISILLKFATLYCFNVLVSVKNKICHRNINQKRDNLRDNSMHKEILPRQTRESRKCPNFTIAHYPLGFCAISSRDSLA